MDDVVLQVVHCEACRCPDISRVTYLTYCQLYTPWSFCSIAGLDFKDLCIKFSIWPRGRFVQHICIRYSCRRYWACLREINLQLAGVSNAFNNQSIIRPCQSSDFHEDAHTVSSAHLSLRADLQLVAPQVHLRNRQTRARYSWITGHMLPQHTRRISGVLHWVGEHPVLAESLPNLHLVQLLSRLA